MISAGCTGKGRIYPMLMNRANLSGRRMRKRLHIGLRRQQIRDTQMQWNILAEFFSMITRSRRYAGMKKHLLPDHSMF